MRRKRIFGPRRKKQWPPTVWAVLTVLGLMALPASADAQIMGISLSDGRTLEPADLRTGDQAVITQAGGSLSFAGYDIVLDDFSGTFGYSSDAAYVIVADGSAASQGRTARSGDLLILLPGGEGTAVAIYDAARYAGSWRPSDAASHGVVHDRLKAIASRQKWKLFFGRLTPTAFNIAAPGSGKREQARRSVVGDDAIRQIRFAGQGSGADAERLVVETFTEALVAGDVETVAALLDPAPYGATDLRYGGGDARTAMARQLLGRRNWQALSGAGVQKIDDYLWRVAGGGAQVQIALRPTSDIAFVQSVQTGE